VYINARTITLHAMIIQCDFTNASDFVRERVVFLTDFQIMIDADNMIYTVSWDISGPTSSLEKLRRAMHDSEFRIHLDRAYLLMTLAKGLGSDLTWSIWMFGIDWRPRNAINAKLCTLQRFFRHGVALKRLNVDKIFSKAKALREQLVEKLQGNNDVVMKIIEHYLCDASVKKTNNLHRRFQDRPLHWIKPHGDGHIFLRNT